jgi:hypothetical protein
MAGQEREARLRARCPGHPRLQHPLKKKDMNARHKAGTTKKKQWDER